MSYTKTIWKDRIVDPTTKQVIQEGTPLSATNLNKIENQLELITQRTEEVGPYIQTIVADITQIVFDLSLQNLVNSTDMKHVFVDKIESISDVNLLQGMYSNGKVYI